MDESQTDIIQLSIFLIKEYRLQMRYCTCRKFVKFLRIKMCCTESDYTHFKNTFLKLCV